MRCFQLEEFKFFYRKPFTKRIYGDLRDWITHKLRWKRATKTCTLFGKITAKRVERDVGRFTNLSGNNSGSCRLQKVVTERRESFCFLQQHFASCNNLICSETGWLVGSKTGNITFQLEILQNKLHVSVAPFTVNQRDWDGRQSAYLPQIKSPLAILAGRS